METSFAVRVHVDNTVNAVNGSTGREIWALDVLHVLLNRNLRHGEISVALCEDSRHVQVNRTSNLGEVMRRDSCCHTNRNTVASIEKKVR